MTDVIPGTGGPGKPNTRFSSTHRAIWTLLGHSCSGTLPHNQSGREHLYPGNAERRGGRSATMASTGLGRYFRTNDVQDGLEINRRRAEV